MAKAFSNQGSNNVLLASKFRSYVNGQNIAVDGGYTCI